DEVWESREVGSLLTSAGRVEAPACVFCLEGTDRSELLGIEAEGVRAILRVIDLLHQARMGNGDMIALQIVIDIDLPVAIDDIVATLGKLQTIELVTTRLPGILDVVKG